MQLSHRQKNGQKHFTAGKVLKKSVAAISFVNHIRIFWLK
jgi:hypothetical protein